jgi:hypothetical protein
MEITSETLDLLDAAGLGRAIFADVDPNPNEMNAAAGVVAFNDGVLSEENGLKRAGRSASYFRCQNAPLFAISKPAQRSSAWP